RDKAIDRLLASDEFNDRWTLWFGDLVQNTQFATAIGQGTGAGSVAYYKWIRQSLAERKPYDAMVRELLTGSGDPVLVGTVNYIWKELFGLGIVEPADNFDLEKLDTQASHPQLLEDLTDAFIAGGYDLRALMRVMTQSNTYQLASHYDTGAWNESYTPYFARHYPRRLQAEMLFDAMYRATSSRFDVCQGTPAICSQPGALHVTKTVASPDPYFLLGFNIGQFLSDFGAGDRDVIERSN